MELSLEELERLLAMLKQNGASSSPGTRKRARKSSSQEEPKKKRKPSAYQLEVGRQLKALKKKHPRTPISRLMKRAHAAAKKKRRG